MKDFSFKKRFGQNFINDKNLLNAIAEDAEICARDEVLEIGAGAGSLTHVLSQKCKKVVSFEIDKDLKPILEETRLTNVEFVFEDFLKCNLAEIENKFDSSYKVVANLPYYITTPIIFKLLEEGTKVSSITIMVQKEVAQRVCASVGGKDYGILTVMTNVYGDATISRIVKRQMFFPVPNVDSAVLNIKLRKDKFPNLDKKEFASFVKVCFGMRRKTLLNNLVQKFDKQKILRNLEGVDLSRRAESFSVQELFEIFNLLN